MDEEGKRLGFKDIFDVWRTYKLARRRRAMDFKREAIIRGPFPHLNQIIEELVDAVIKYSTNKQKVL